MKDAIVIAKKSDFHYGFKKGDTLKIVKRGVAPELYYAKNLTRPGYGGDDLALISESELRVITLPGTKVIEREIRLFGITIHTKMYTEQSE